MIDALKRKLGLSQAPAPEAVNQNEGTVEMTDVTVATATAEVVDAAPALADFAALQTTVASLTEQLAANASALAEKDSKIAELSALVEAAVEFKAAQAQATAEAKVATRVAALAEVVGTEQATTLEAALASLDDGAFQVALSAMTTKLKVEASAPAFKEVGVEGTTDTTKLAAESNGSRVMDYLKTIAKENQAI